MSDAPSPLVEMRGMSISFGGVRAVEMAAATAHNMPISTKTSTVTRLVSTPDSSVASGLPPSANT